MRQGVKLGAGELQKLWVDEGLAVMADGGVRIAPTFIEEVGTASAENVRSAALKRAFNLNPDACSAWLTSLGISVPATGPLRVGRELDLDGEGRVDLSIADARGQHVAFVEVKWLSPPRTAQLVSYKKSMGPVPLVLLSPVAFARPYAEATAGADAAATWSGLLPHLEAADGELMRDLRLTVRRLESMEAWVSRAVQEGRPVSDLQEVHAWLAADSQRLGLDVHFRRFVVTSLADRVVAELSALEPAAGWRRAVTVDGPRRDSQSDVTPEAWGDGVAAIPGTDRKACIFLRFHVDPGFERLKVVIGTSLLPYLEGREKSAWQQGHPDQIKACFDQLDTLRAGVSRELGLPRREAPGRQWYKGFGGRAFGGTRRLSAVVAAGRDLAPKLARLCGQS